MPKTECPKCGSGSAWYQTTYCDVILRCLCGYHKVVQTTIEDITIRHTDAGAEIKLPKRGSHVWTTLVALLALEVANSATVTQRVMDLGHALTVSEVSSHLTVLRNKGLVYPLDSKRGVAGGSTWAVTDACLRLFNL